MMEREEYCTDCDEQTAHEVWLETAYGRQSARVTLCGECGFRLRKPVGRW